MKKKLTKSEAGKLGSEVSHKKRYEMLKELSKYVDKDTQDFLIKWPTKHLKVVVDLYKTKWIKN